MTTPTVLKELDGAVRVWHIPQVPGPIFYVSVPSGSILEAQGLRNLLSRYDLFQFDNHIKPDYASDNGIEVYNADDGEWEDAEED